MIDRLEATVKRYNEITSELSKPEVIQDIKKMTELSREQTRLTETVELYGRYKQDLVILIHEKEQTVEALDGIITVLKARGYKILPITEDTEAMNFWKKNL